jgi:hypothetical protein
VSNPSPSPNSPKPPFSQQLTDVLIKLWVTGSGGVSVYFLFTDHLPKALIAGTISLGSGLLTSFGQGFADTLKEGFQRRGEQLAHRVDQALDTSLGRLVRSNFRVEAQYCKAFTSHCYALNVEGTNDCPNLSLEDIFVPLQVQSRSGGGPGFQGNLQGCHEIWAFLPRKSESQFRYRRITIVAQPGYGKSTLLRHLTLTYASNPRNPRPGMRSFLPILLRYRDIYLFMQRPVAADMPLQKDDPGFSLAAVMARQLQRLPEFAALGLSVAWFETRLDQGRCLVLLDGLDEVPKEIRWSISEWTDYQMRACPRCQFIVTSRPHAIELHPDDAQIHQLEQDLRLQILDFTPRQQDEFITKWYVALTEQRWQLLVETDRRKAKRSRLSPAPARLSPGQVQIQIREEADKQARDLIRQVGASRSLTALARNPLLLTMIANTHLSSPDLPQRRVELYDRICNLLLGTRPNIKGTRLTLTATQNRRVLQILALNLVQREVTQFTPEESEAWIQDCLEACCKDKTLSPQQFLLEMVQISGLVVEQEYGAYEFSHQTFQEYFAAVQLREMGAQGAVLVGEQRDNDRWQEVILLYVATGDASPIIEKLLDDSNSESLELAKRCQDEGREVSRAVRERLAQARLQPATDAPKLDPYLQLEQRFHSLVQLDATTAITSAPITWDEYITFLGELSGDLFHGKAQGAIIEPSAEQLRHPAIAPLHKVASHQLNQPVINIVWEDALWFCAWLATQGQLPQPDEGIYDYRLPTVAELEQLPKSNLKSWTTKPDQPGQTILVVRQHLPERYKALVNYLTTERWKEADQATAKIMLEVAGQTQRGWLDQEAIQKFPCEALRILDQLWVHFSGGHFGFSVQKRIYVETGNPLDGEYHYTSYVEFVRMVGWTKEGGFLNYSDLIFSLDAPVGSLPWVVVGSRAVVYLSDLMRVRVGLLSRQDL